MEIDLDSVLEKLALCNYKAETDMGKKGDKPTFIIGEDHKDNQSIWYEGRYAISYKRNVWRAVAQVGQFYILLRVSKELDNVADVFCHLRMLQKQRPDQDGVPIAEALFDLHVHNIAAQIQDGITIICHEITNSKLTKGSYVDYSIYVDYALINYQQFQTPTLGLEIKVTSDEWQFTFNSRQYNFQTLRDTVDFIISGEYKRD